MYKIVIQYKSINMPLKNPQHRKEYARISMAILKAKQKKKDITELLEKRKKLIQIPAEKKPARKVNKLKKNQKETFLKKLSHQELLGELKKRLIFGVK